MNSELGCLRMPPLLAIVFCALVSCAPSLFSQQNSDDRPLGDVARQARAAKQESTSKSRKVFHKVGSATKKSEDSTSAATFATPSAAPEQATEPQKSVFDRPPEPDIFTLPVGTQIRVKVRYPGYIAFPTEVAAKVVVPVRVGFSTAIHAPAVTVRFIPGLYVYTSLPDPQKITSAIELRTVTIENVTYDIRSDLIPLYFSTPGLDTEVAFTLLEPLQIRR